MPIKDDENPELDLEEIDLYEAGQYEDEFDDGYTKDDEDIFDEDEPDISDEY